MKYVNDQMIKEFLQICSKNDVVDFGHMLATDEEDIIKEAVYSIRHRFNRFLEDGIAISFWTWDGDKKICKNCGKEIYFDGTYSCFDCGLQSND